MPAPSIEELELKQLRTKIKEANIPARKKDNLLIATWNIRNFSAKKSDRAIKYIAEICKNFDIAAIQEVKPSLKPLEKLQKEIGTDYRFIFSDQAGNNERLVFLYHKKRVDFTGLAAEIVLDPGIRDKLEVADMEFDRTPFMVSFRANNSNFVLVTVHIYYGKGEMIKYREKEIIELAKFIKKRSAEHDAIDPDIMVLGDFNIENIDDKYFQALKSGGLHVPKEIQSLPTNLKGDKHYDQIAFVKYKDSTAVFSGKAGIVDFKDILFTDMTLKQKSYALTDHLPLWAELHVSPDTGNPNEWINP